LPEAVGNDAAHFDILLARNLASNRQSSGDWLVLQLQELISLAYQVNKRNYFVKNHFKYSGKCPERILTRSTKLFR